MTRRQVLRLCTVLVLGLALLYGCQSVQGTLKPDGPAVNFNRMIRAELIFGLSNPDGPITEQNWQSFLDEVITPRFRDGLSVFEVSGQWMNQAGVLEREKSKMVLILYDPSPEKDQALEEIRAKYKERFKQESVLLIMDRPEVSF